MNDCAHSNIKKGTVHREFLGRVFKAGASVCSDCGAELWDEKLNTDFKFWVDGLDVKHKVQFKISAAAEKCLGEVLKLFPSAHQTSLVRIMLGIYLDLLDRVEARDVLNRAFESNYYARLQSEEADRLMGYEIKPLLYLDLQTWANLLDVKSNELAAEAFLIMLSLCIDEDEMLRDFWNREILPGLVKFLKAS